MQLDLQDNSLVINKRRQPNIMPARAKTTGETIARFFIVLYVPLGRPI